MNPVLLPQVLPLIHGALEGGSDPCVEILRSIKDHFKLEDVVLKLFYFPGTEGRSLSATKGHWGPLEGPLEIVEKRVMTSRRPGEHDGRLFWPLPSPGKSLGLLQLQLPASVDRADLQFEVDLVVHQLSLFLLSRRGPGGMIGHFPVMPGELARFSSPDKLLPFLGRRMFGYNRCQAVVLRPLLGGTVLGDGWSFVVPGQRSMTPVFLQLEEEHSSALIRSGDEIMFRQLEARDGQAAVFRPSMLVLPLVGSERMLGTLTFFGGDWPIEGGDHLTVAGAKTASQVAAVVANVMERVLAREQSAYLSVERDQKLRDTATLLRIARAMHSTLRLNELTHLILSAAVSPRGGGFERALLFMLNERTQTLQGMLGVDREAAAMILSDRKTDRLWERPDLSPDVLDAQRMTAVSRSVVKQRLPLDPGDNPLARAVSHDKVVLVQHPATDSPSEATLAGELQLAPYACVPLRGKEGCFGVLVLDNPQSREPIPADRIRFLEIFASQAGTAMENAQLLSRLEHAHRDLMETQEKLIQGERLAVLGEMSASVAHELKNPLVSIGGFARRLGRLEPGDPRQSEYGKIIAREVVRMEELLRNILAFSKQQILCLAPCNLSEVVRESLEVFSETMASQGIVLETEGVPELPLIQGDSQKLRQVLINLLSNACHVMPEGGQLWIRTRLCQLRGDKAVEVEVEDSGPGIAVELMRNIFNPFFTSKEQGTGLGLSISHRIIEHHQGEIEVANTEGGARFRVRLPVKQPGAPNEHLDQKKSLGL